MKPPDERAIWYLRNFPFTVMLFDLIAAKTDYFCRLRKNKNDKSGCKLCGDDGLANLVLDGRKDEEYKAALKACERKRANMETDLEYDKLRYLWTIFNRYDKKANKAQRKAFPEWFGQMDEDDAEQEVADEDDYGGQHGERQERAELLAPAEGEERGRKVGRIKLVCCLSLAIMMMAAVILIKMTD